MKTMISILLACVVSLPAVAADNDNPNKRICKMVKIEGNRTKTKVCQPQSFWDEQMRIEQDAVDGKPVDVQSRARTQD